MALTLLKKYYYIDMTKEQKLWKMYAISAPFIVPPTVLPCTHLVMMMMMVHVDDDDDEGDYPNYVLKG